MNDMTTPKPAPLPASNETTVFIINGAPRSGKDTLVDFLSTELNRRGALAGAFSSIDPIRNMLNEMGIDTSAKTRSDRNLLAIVGSAVEVHSQFRSRSCIQFVLAWIQKVRGARSGLFLHIREPETIELVRANLQNLGIRVIRIRLESNRSEMPGNATDAGTNEMRADYLLRNNGTLGELYDEAAALLNLIEGRRSDKRTAGIPEVTPKFVHNHATM